MSTNTVFCPKCGAANLQLNSACTNCGHIVGGETPQPMVAPPGYAVTTSARPPGADKKIAAGICGILLGGLGIHKFILGYPVEGTIMLITAVVGALFCGAIPTLVVGVIGLIEGILYLTKSDQEFVDTYVTAKKGWF